MIKLKNRQEKDKLGSSRTRTYTRWGKQHSLNFPKSPDSDLSDLESVASSQDQDETSFSTEINDSRTTGITLSSRLTDEYCFAEPSGVGDQETNVDTGTKKRTPQVVIEKAIEKDCVVPKTHIAVLNPVISGILKDMNSELSEEQGHIIQGTGDVPTNILVLSGVRTENECQISYDANETLSGIDKYRKGSHSPGIFTNLGNKVNDMEGIEPNGSSVVNIYEDLAVSPIGDSQKNQTIAADSNSECDLTSFLDIQSFLSTYPTTQQSVTLATNPSEKLTVELGQGVPHDKTDGSSQDILACEPCEIITTNSEYDGGENALKSVGNETVDPTETQTRFIQIVDNMTGENVNGLPVCVEDAGFHDYCLMSDYARFTPTQTQEPAGSVLPSEKESYNKAISETELDRRPNCGSDNALIDGETVVELPPEEINRTLSSPTENGNSGVVLEAECISEVDIPPPDCAWRDTHIMIIQHPVENDPKDQQETSEPLRLDQVENKMWSCPWCSNFYSKVVQMKRHAKTAHPECVHRCSFCERMFINKDKCDSHMDWCRVKEKLNGRYHCPHCTYTAAKIYHVVDHYRTKHTNKLQRKCGSCDQVFSSLNSYYDHLLKTHNVDSSEIVNRKVHECKECNFRTVKLYAFKSHKLQHVKDRCLCDVCDKTFKSLEILKRHKKIIHGGNMFKCRLCNFKSRYAATVKTHEYRRHNFITSDQQKVHFCHYCDYSNINQADLKKHELNKHSDERPFLCSFCTKGFKHKHQVVIHERVHTGIRPFKCNLCSYAGRTKVALVTHTRHRHSSVKAFVCEMCGFRTKGSSNLWFHKTRCRKKLVAKVMREVVPLGSGSN